MGLSIQQPVAERVAIIGAGTVGMVLATRARAAGHQVTLYEAAPVVGGLASAWTVGPVTWDRFYHVILGSDTAWRGVLAELGLDDEIRWKATRTGCLVDTKMHSVSSPVELLRFSPLPPLARLRLGATLAWASKARNGRALERVLVADWLKKLSGQTAFDRFWQPLLRAKLGDSWPRTSAAFLWATAQRLGKARSSGLGDEQFGYVPGGYARIMNVFADRLRADGVETCTGVRVQSVANVSGTKPVVVTDTGSTSFDRVIVTAPCPIAAKMIDGLSVTDRTLLGGVQYQGAICVSLVLDQPLHPFYLSNLLTDTSLTAIVDMSALVDSDELSGRGLVYLPRYCSPSDPLFDASDDEVITAFVDEIRRIYPAFSHRQVIASAVARARHVFAVPTLRYSDIVPGFDTAVPGVSVVNSAQIVNATLNVDESVQLADRAFVKLFGQGSIHPPAQTFETAMVPA